VSTGNLRGTQQGGVAGQVAINPICAAVFNYDRWLRKKTKRPSIFSEELFSSEFLISTYTDAVGFR
jgi:hypothetical protein